MCRVHILGASGAGTTTLGRAVAEDLGVAFLDTDSFFWLPSEPPYRQRRECSERTELLDGELRRHERWVLAGSLCGWGDVFVPLFDLVVYLSVPQEIRMARLERRELSRFGAARLGVGGDMHDQHREFSAWARAYDEGGESRSKRGHAEWLGGLPDPSRVLRLSGTSPIPELVRAIAEANVR
jgi:adenylate kinase family enzyme